MIVVAIRDRAVDSYGNPVFVPAIGAALRSFMDEMNNPESVMNKHPEDYDLYKMGTYDPATGLFDCGVPNMIAIGKDQLNKE